MVEVPAFSAEANAVLDKLAAEFSVDDALQVSVLSSCAHRCWQAGDTKA